MTADVEVRALALLDEAMDQPSDVRETWIVAQPDAPARDRALTLLRRASPQFLHTGGGLRVAASQTPPERIGAYRITGLIGEGGMGAVYRGERATGDFDHAVAIKVVRPGVLSDALVERFQRERQTLAKLAHPNIARLFDGGETAGGEPYIVMELVEGLPLGEWMAGPRTAAERTALFLQVCAAVAFAHQNLIVHRDITPSNVLVQADGAPKLIDFGIARAPEAATTAPRPMAALSLTPGFAAPERLAGEAATTLGDVYSLGRLLDALFPTPRPRDLDAIVAKATVEAPSDRYATVDALADDLVAWRDIQPVAARGGGRSYVAGRFIRRRRGLVITASAALALLVAAFAVTSWSYVRAESARRVEAERFGQVRALARYMIFDLNDRLAQVAGNTAARADIAAEAQRYLDRLVATPQASDALKRETAHGLIRLARIQGVPSEPNLGQIAQASENLAAADRLLAALPADSAQKTDRALVQVYEGLILLRAEGRQADAAPRIEAANAAVAAIPTADRDGRWIETRRATRKAAMELADVSDHRDRLPALADAMLADMDAWPATMRTSDAADLDRAFVTYYRALHTQLDDDLGKAVQAHLAAGRQFDVLLAKRPNDPALLSLATWNAYDGYATASRAGQEDISARMIVEARENVDRLRAVDDRDLAAARLSFNIREAQAQDLRDRDHFAEAQALQREVVAGRREQATREPNARTVGSVGFSLAIQGVIAKDAGDRAQACASWREARDVFADLDAKGTIMGFYKSFLPGLTRNVAACEAGKPLSAMGPLKS